MKRGALLLDATDATETETLHDDSDTSLEKVQKTEKDENHQGMLDAQNGLERLSLEKLTLKYGYTPLQCADYLNSYDVAQLKQIQENRRIGRSLELQGDLRPRIENLLAEKYSLRDATALLQGYDAQHLGGPKFNGAIAGKSGGARPTIALIKRRNNYTDEQANAYLAEFDKFSRDGNTPNTADVTPPAVSESQTRTLLSSFLTKLSQESITELQQKKMRRCKIVGKKIAMKNFPCPDKDTLMLQNSYTEEEALAYITGYNSVAARRERRRPS